MSRSISSTLLLASGFAVLSLLTPMRGAQAQTTYDLATDWSDTANPNGVWSYGLLSSSGTTFTPFALHVNNYINVGPPGFTGNQSAWTDVPNTGNNGTPEGLAKSTGIAINGLDFPAGRVGGHTPLGSSYLATRWTAPQAGTLSITGGLWTWGNIGRTEEGSLFVNGSALFSNVVIPNPPVYTSANTLSLANAITIGGGNANSLLNINVKQGDTIVLGARRQNVEWYVGFDEMINFTPSASPVPEPSATALLLAGGLTGAGWLLRRRRAEQAV